MLQFIVRNLGRLFLWTVVIGMIKDAREKRRRDPTWRERSMNTRTRIYFLLALAVLAVLFLSSL